MLLQLLLLVEVEGLIRNPMLWILWIPALAYVVGTQFIGGVEIVFFLRQLFLFCFMY